MGVTSTILNIVHVAWASAIVAGIVLLIRRAFLSRQASLARRFDARIRLISACLGLVGIVVIYLCMEKVLPLMTCLIALPAHLAALVSVLWFVHKRLPTVEGVDRTDTSRR